MSRWFYRWNTNQDVIVRLNWDSLIPAPPKESCCVPSAGAGRCATTSKRDMGPVGWASQYQQRPVPRGGGILPYNGWEYWSKSTSLIYGRSESQFPDFDFILGVLDTAYGEKQENDYSAFVVLGTWTNLYGQPQVMVMHVWRKRLKFHDLVDEVIKAAEKYRCDRVLVENKASGISIFQEIVRLTRDESFAISWSTPREKIRRQERTASLISLARSGTTGRGGRGWCGFRA